MKLYLLLYLLFVPSKGNELLVQIGHDALFSWTLDPKPIPNEPIWILDKHGNNVFSVSFKTLTITKLYKGRIESENYTTDGNIEFTLKQTKQSDAGIYNASYTAGTFYGQELILLGKPKRPIIHIIQQPILDNTMLLICRDVSTNISLSLNVTTNYTWILDRKLNTTIDRISYEGPRLEMSDVSLEDTGMIITCQAFEKASVLSEESEPYIVDVHYGPHNLSITPRMYNYSLPSGFSLNNVTCDASCNPICNYTWKTDDDDLFNDFERGKILTNVDCNYSGKYFCRAQNYLGHSDSRRINVFVSGQQMLPASAVEAKLVFIFIIPSCIIFCIIILKMKKKICKEQKESSMTISTQEQASACKRVPKGYDGSYRDNALYVSCEQFNRNILFVESFPSEKTVCNDTYKSGDSFNKIGKEVDHMKLQFQNDSQSGASVVNVGNCENTTAICNVYVDVVNVEKKNDEENSNNKGKSKYRPTPMPRKKKQIIDPKNTAYPVGYLHSQSDNDLEIEHSNDFINGHRVNCIPIFDARGNEIFSEAGIFLETKSENNGDYKDIVNDQIECEKERNKEKKNRYDNNDDEREPEEEGEEVNVDNDDKNDDGHYDDDDDDDDDDDNNDHEDDDDAEVDDDDGKVDDVGDNEDSDDDDDDVDGNDDDDDDADDDDDGDDDGDDDDENVDENEDGQEENSIAVGGSYDVGGIGRGDIELEESPFAEKISSIINTDLLKHNARFDDDVVDDNCGDGGCGEDGGCGGSVKRVIKSRIHDKSCKLNDTNESKYNYTQFGHYNHSLNYINIELQKPSDLIHGASRKTKYSDLFFLNRQHDDVN